MQNAIVSDSHPRALTSSKASSACSNVKRFVIRGFTFTLPLATRSTAIGYTPAEYRILPVQLSCFTSASVTGKLTNSRPIPACTKRASGLARKTPTWMHGSAPDASKITSAPEPKSNLDLMSADTLFAYVSSDSSASLNGILYTLSAA
ncbi:hypothetical protein OGATHE_001546 [Ogataea polymorpha]|uniref:Uncharacterized protein n=1 Tax=Ogataea polymorpha TaxID=460523 RepID=A0A9P8PPE5_9ASCO|nr:hypothetical protein OGATHE_001546 [Ogataea polymorpha]